MYEKPTVIKSNDLAEGVFMASGGTGSGCYTTTARIHQKPETGRGDYRIQIDAKHDAAHHSTHQVLTISFNEAVQYSWSNGTLKSGDGTNTLVVEYKYHNNGNDNIGLGDLIVVADAGLAITSVSMDDTGWQFDRHEDEKY